MEENQLIREGTEPQVVEQEQEPGQEAIEPPQEKLQDIDQLVFRIYEPQTEALQKMDIVHRIDVYPADALNMVEDIIRKSIEEAPDLEKVNITLAPRKADADLKRIMKPQIDELIDETKSALSKLKAKKGK